MLKIKPSQFLIYGLLIGAVVGMIIENLVMGAALGVGFGLVITIEGERSRRVNGEMVSSMENLPSGIKMEINLF